MKKLSILFWIILPILLSIVVIVGCQEQPAPAPPITPTQAPELTPTAEFEVTPITITPNEVVSGETFTVSTEIKNVGGADGVYTAKLTINGTEVATKDIAVASGATETVSFTLTEETPGNYMVALNNLTGSFEVLKLPSAQEIVDGVIKALDDRKSYEFEMDMSLDGAGKFGGEPVETAMTLVASGALDPENRQMRFDMTASAAPWGEDERAMAVEMYLVDNMVYMMQDVTETGPMWSKEEIPETYFEQVNEQLSEQANTLTELHTELLQAAQVSIIGSEKVKGVDCYVLQLTPDVQQLWQSVAEQIALTGGVLTRGGVILPYGVDQEYLQERLSFSMKQWVAKDTYFLIRSEINMTIELNLEAMLADAPVATPAPPPPVEEEAQFNIDFTMSYLAYNYNQPISIQVPPEAEAAGSATQAVPVPAPELTEQAKRELANLQAAVVAMMVDNAISILPNPVSTDTSDMSAFPDATSVAGSADKQNDGNGNAYAVGDKDGFILYTHDITGDGVQTGLVNYVATQYTKGTYTVDASGTVTQVTTTQAVPAPAPTPSPETVITFPDGNLKDVIVEALGKEDLTAADLAKLTELNADKMGITDLSGIENCVNLTNLNLFSNQISDISLLSSFTSLTSLHLSGNQINDIKPLASLTSLEMLYLGGNQISDISALSSLTNLKDLALSGNQISDISPLASLTNLVGLSLYGNQISDISALSSLTNLKPLYLNKNQISDISPLASLTNLTKLNLRENRISNLSPLASLTNLRELNLGYNQISDISPLASLTNLTRLYLNNNQISDISPLVENSGLGKGNAVWLGHNNLDLSESSKDMKQLEERGVIVNY